MQVGVVDWSTREVQEMWVFPVEGRPRPAERLSTLLRLLRRRPELVVREDEVETHLEALLELVPVLAEILIVVVQVHEQEPLSAQHRDEARKLPGLTRLLDQTLQCVQVHDQGLLLRKLASPAVFQRGQEKKI